jgi:DNA-binding GntR family transcriptional regulator
MVCEHFPRSVRALRLGRVVMAAHARRRVPYEEIAADIRAQIASGKLEPGSQIGSLRALRQHYGVAEGTVQSALRMLRDEGLVETFQGRGSYVLRTPAEPEPTPEYRALAAEVSRLAARVEALEAQRAGKPEGDRHGDPA